MAVTVKSLDAPSATIAAMPSSIESCRKAFVRLNQHVERRQEPAVFQHLGKGEPSPLPLQLRQSAHSTSGLVKRSVYINVINRRGKSLTRGCRRQAGSPAYRKNCDFNPNNKFWTSCPSCDTFAARAFSFGLADRKIGCFGAERAVGAPIRIRVGGFRGTESASFGAAVTSMICQFLRALVCFKSLSSGWLLIR